MFPELGLISNIFIEYYADAPMTPVQAAETKKIYDP